MIVAYAGSDSLGAGGETPGYPTSPVIGIVAGTARVVTDAFAAVADSTFASGRAQTLERWTRRPKTARALALGSTRGTAKASRLSDTTVLGIWHAFGLQSHRSDTFKLSAARTAGGEGAGYCWPVPQSSAQALVLCADEKSQIHAWTEPSPSTRCGRVRQSCVPTTTGDTAPHRSSPGAQPLRSLHCAGVACPLTTILTTVGAIKPARWWTSTERRIRIMNLPRTYPDVSGPVTVELLIPRSQVRPL